ncbi:MAG TPA: nucleoside deaminase [Gemmatimonadales bacterium]|nr:nucleoside deaminase [Gemmatimonadales bacterium]
MPESPREIRIDYPEWVGKVVDWERDYPTDTERMRLAIALARENVERGTGGPFGAAVFAVGGGLVAIGVNSVVRLSNCALHAEMMAFMMAQQRVGSFTLAAPGLPDHEMFASCEPCAMCLGATLWSGVCRVVYSARGEDARALGFDEGPVFPESHAYLASRGIRLEGGFLREEARAVLARYRDLAGPVYNRIPGV